MAYEILESFDEAVPLPEVKQESIPAWATRQLARLGTRAGEAILGAPGDIVQTLGLLGKIASPEQQLLTMQQPQTSEDQLAFIQQGLAQGKPSAIFGRATERLQDVRPPTTEELKTEYTKPFEEKYLPQNYLSSQNSYEEAGDELISDITTLANPLFGLVGTPMKAARALKTAGLGNLAAWGARGLGLPERMAQGLKVGTIFGVTLAGEKGLAKTAEEIYDLFKGKIPDTTMSAIPLQEAQDELLYYYQQGLRKATPGKSKVWDVLTETFEKFKGPEVPIKRVWEIKKDINKVSSSLFGKGEKGAAKALDDFSKSLSSAIYKEDRGFGKILKQADELYRGVGQANKINNFVLKTLKDNKKILAPGAFATLLFNPWLAAKGALGVGGAYIGAHGLNMMNQFATNPTIRNEYLKMMAAGAKQVAPQVIKSASRMNKAAEDTKGRFEVIETF